jgi:hypothetical protein
MWTDVTFPDLAKPLMSVSRDSLFLAPPWFTGVLVLGCHDGALPLSLTRSSHRPKLPAHCHCLRPGTQVLVSFELRFPSCPFYHNTSCNHHDYPCATFQPHQSLRRRLSLASSLPFDGKLPCKISASCSRGYLHAPRLQPRRHKPQLHAPSVVRASIQVQKNNLFIAQGTPYI